MIDTCHQKKTPVLHPPDVTQFCNGGDSRCGTISCHTGRCQPDWGGTVVSLRVLDHRCGSDARLRQLNEVQDSWRWAMAWCHMARVMWSWHSSHSTMVSFHWLKTQNGTLTLSLWAFVNRTWAVISYDALRVTIWVRNEDRIPTDCMWQSGRL